MHSAAAWFALVIAGIGWFYIFGSQAAQRLETVEAQAVNRRRVRLRVCNGACLIALGSCMFAGLYSVEPASRPWLFVGVWIAVMLLLAVCVALALVDVRLTMRLRRSSGGNGQQGGGP
ncbi:MAG TPA: hypothetical protein VHY37_11325 [Tepidisphaeraceae bacterium]|nr:hypothetical protein [Tepidisphaeraceae bacterium]